MSVSTTILHHPQLIEKFQEHCLFQIPVQQNRYRIECMIFILSLTFSLLEIPNVTNDNEIFGAKLKYEQRTTAQRKDDRINFAKL